MTTRISRHDEHVVDSVLAEAGGHQPDALREALLELRGFAHGPALSPYGVERRRRPAIDLAGPRRFRRKAGLASLAVVAAMGLGAGAAAAVSPDFRSSAQQTVAGLIGTFAGPVVPAAPAFAVSTPSAPPAPAVSSPAAAPTSTPARAAEPVRPAPDQAARGEEPTSRPRPTLPALPVLPEQASRATAGPRAPGVTTLPPRHREPCMLRRPATQAAPATRPRIP